MHFKSVADLSFDIKSNLHKIPRDVSLVVGIPRSGLLAANLIALYLNLPLTDIDSFLEGRILATGLRGERYLDQAFRGRILVVDDSIYSGTAMKKAKERLSAADSNFRFVFSCVYALPGTGKLIDLPFQFVEEPRVFEWNIFHSPVFAKACVDIDGVLCVDPSEAENDDGEQYIKFLSSAVPKIIPKVKVSTLVTSRLEKYRKETEAWLRNHGIQYDELVMLNVPDKASRLRLACHADFKASEFTKRTESTLFIESSISQAERIHELTGKSVYCVDTNEMLSKATTPFSNLRTRSTRELSHFKHFIKRHLRRFGIEKTLKPFKQR